MGTPRLSEEEKNQLIKDVMAGKVDASELEKHGINMDDDYFDDDEADELLKTTMDEIDPE